MKLCCLAGLSLDRDNPLDYDSGNPCLALLS